MFTCLPPPVRPAGKFRLPAFWCGAAVASLVLVCLLCSGQPHAFTPPRTEQPLREEFFPPAFIPAVPGIGLMSEVRESGPYLRATATAWPGGSGPRIHF